MTCGIYTITSPSGRVYVGQSVDIERRFSEYRRSGSVRKQRRLAASFAKYGVESHVFCIAQECAEDVLSDMERQWQERMITCGTSGLNCRLVAANDKTGRFSESSRQRMSEKQRGKGNPNFGKRGAETSCFGRKRTDDERKAISVFQRQRGQIILQIDPTSGLIVRKARAWEYVAEGFSQGNISSCCTGRLKTHKGFRFQYEAQTCNT